MAGREAGLLPPERFDVATRNARPRRNSRAFSNGAEAGALSPPLLRVWAEERGQGRALELGDLALDESLTFSEPQFLLTDPLVGGSV